MEATAHTLSLLRKSISVLAFLGLTAVGSASVLAQPVGDPPADDPPAGDSATPATPDTPPAPAAPPPPEEPAPLPPAPVPPPPEVAPAPAPEDLAPLTDEPAAADVEEKPGLVLSGASFVTRYELREHYNRIGITTGRFGESDAISYRARLGMASTPIDVGEDRVVTVSMTPQGSGFWADSSGGLTDAAFNLHEAKLRVAGAANWFDIGRFEMIYGDHLVIGNVGWHETGRSFDGARGHVAIGDKGAYLDLFATQIAEGRPDSFTPFFAGDHFFTGAYAGLGPELAEGMDLDGYLFAQLWPKTDFGPNAHDFHAVEVTLGSRIKKPIGKVTVHGEGGLQVGKRGVVDEKVIAFHIDGGLMAKLNDQAQAGAEGFYASGDDTSTGNDEGWNQLYPTAHKFLGFMDIMGGRTNVTGGVVKGRFAAMPKLDLGADVHFFMRPQTPDGVDGYTGTEGDLWGVYKLGKGLDFRGGYSLFLPNDSGPLGSSDKVHYVELQLAYNL